MKAIPAMESGKYLRNTQMSEKHQLSIIDAYGRNDEVKVLFYEYTKMLLSIDPSFSIYLDLQHYEDEAANPAVKYSLPYGRLYIALCDGRVAGCIALRPLDEGKCELKRLYVRPGFRGKGIARKLCEKIIQEARAIGYREIYLDTLPELKDAIILYEKLGFEKTECYNDSPIEKTIFMKKILN